jgi:hypothetical protein
LLADKIDNCGGIGLYLPSFFGTKGGGEPIFNTSAFGAGENIAIKPV